MRQSAQRFVQQCERLEAAVNVGVRQISCKLATGPALSSSEAAGWLDKCSKRLDLEHAWIWAGEDLPGWKSFSIEKQQTQKANRDRLKESFRSATNTLQVICPIMQSGDAKGKPGDREGIVVF